jgi:hypothetical protein
MSLIPLQTIFKKRTPFLKARTLNMKRQQFFNLLAKTPNNNFLKGTAMEPHLQRM